MISTSTQLKVNPGLVLAQDTDARNHLDRILGRTPFSSPVTKLTQLQVNTWSYVLTAHSLRPQNHEKVLCLNRWLFPHLPGFGDNVQPLISHLCFFPPPFFFEAEISWHTLISLFMPGPVYIGSASWDDCSKMFPDKLHVSSFPDRFPHYAWTAALPAHCGWTKLILDTKSVDSKLWSHNRSAVRPSKTECHAMNERETVHTLHWQYECK